MEYIYGNELYHYGRSKRDGAIRGSGRYPLGSGERGQKIGSASRVRTWRDSPKTTKRPKPPVREAARKSARDMTDEELTNEIKRMNLENNYNNLSRERQSKDALDTTQRAVGELENATNRIRNRNREKIKNRTEHERMDLDHMTDKELRDAINREVLERQYSDLFGPEVKDEVNEGRKKVDGILDKAGDVLAIAGSALFIAKMVRDLIVK